MTTTYHIGGYRPELPNGNLAERHDIGAGTFTRWDEAGKVLEYRALSAEEVESLTPAEAEATTEDRLAVLEAENAALKRALIDKAVITKAEIAAAATKAGTDALDVR